MLLYALEQFVDVKVSYESASKKKSIVARRCERCDEDLDALMVEDFDGRL